MKQSAGCIRSEQTVSVGDISTSIGDSNVFAEGDPIPGVDIKLGHNK